MSSVAATSKTAETTAGIPSDVLVSIVETRIDTASRGECDQLLRSVTRLRSWLDAVEAKTARRLRVLHSAGQSESATNVLAGAENTSARAARSKEDRSRALDTAKGFERGLEHGVVTGEHVDALAKTLSKFDDEVRDKVLEHEDSLVAWASNHTSDELADQLNKLARLAEHDRGVERDRQQRRDTYVSCRLDRASGMYQLSGRLHPELGSRIRRAIQRQVGKMVRDDAELRTAELGRVRAEALGVLVDKPAAQCPSGGAEISVLIDYQTLFGELHSRTVCETSDGAMLEPSRVRQLACQSNLIPVVLSGESVPLDVGRSRRWFTADQRRALRAVHTTCAMASCDIPFEECELHHIDYWEHGGRTDLNNGVPLCSHCHHMIHRPGWHLTLSADRTLHVTTPSGKRLTTKPTRRESLFAATVPTQNEAPPEAVNNRPPSGGGRTGIGRFGVHRARHHDRPTAASNDDDVP